LRQTFYVIVAELRCSGAAVLLSSHALTELEEKTDRVAIMDRGRLIAFGTMARLRAMACLPVRMRIGVREGAPALAAALDGLVLSSCTRNGREVELTCDQEAKMEVVRRVAAFGYDAQDIEIISPTLDELYAHFLEGERPS
jgi:Cu-processing system ATP-binding protein